MPDSDDPFNTTGRDEAAAAAWRGQARRRGTAARDARRRRSPRREPIPDAARDLLGIGLNPLVRAASPLLLLAGQLRGVASRRWTSTGLRHHALEEIRRFEEQRARGRRPERDRPGGTLCAVRGPRRSGAVDAVGRAERVGTASAARGAAPRGVGRREVLRDARPDLAGSRPLHRPDGAAVSLSRVRLRRQVPGAASAVTSASATIQQDLYRKIRNHRGTPPPELSLRWRGLEDRRNPLIRYVPWWVVGAAALAVLAIAFTVYYASLANLAAPVHAELAKIGLEDFAQAPAVPVRGPDAQAAAGAGRSRAAR